MSPLPNSNALMFTTPLKKASTLAPLNHLTPLVEDDFEEKEDDYFHPTPGRVIMDKKLVKYEQKPPKSRSKVQWFEESGDKNQVKEETEADDDVDELKHWMENMKTQDLPKSKSIPKSDLNLRPKAHRKKQELGDIFPFSSAFSSPSTQDLKKVNMRWAEMYSNDGMEPGINQRVSFHDKEPQVFIVDHEESMKDIPANTLRICESVESLPELATDTKTDKVDVKNLMPSIRKAVALHVVHSESHPEISPSAEPIKTKPFVLKRLFSGWWRKSSEVLELKDSASRKK